MALLNERAGVPSWGPELLARTHYALGTGVSTLDSMPDLYERWETWAADIAESHTTYLALVRFRSPQPGARGGRAASASCRVGNSQYSRCDRSQLADCQASDPVPRFFVADPLGVVRANIRSLQVGREHPGHGIETASSRAVPRRSGDFGPCTSYR